MKTAILFALGVLTGLAFSRIPHYVDQYANHSLPKPEYTGEKATMRYFNGGVESFPPPPVIDPNVHVTLGRP